MTKQVIRLTESDLHRIVRESINRVFKETTDYIDDVDISKIPIEDLRKGYKDFRLVPISTMYGHVLYEPVTIKEAVGDTFPPEDAVKSLIQKYDLPPSLVYIREHFHRIYVYAIVARVGINEQLIEEDMKKLGYFLSKKLEIVNVEGMDFQKMQFEPYSQYQEDITDMVKTKFDILYHWTPSYCIEGIQREGLIPNHKNDVFNYPPRTYLMEGDSTDKQRLYLGRLLCAANNNPNNNGEYALLVVDIEKIDNNIRFYYDPNSEIGIYTEQPISSDRIKLQEVVQLRKP